jgi:hypothetical protein
MKKVKAQYLKTIIFSTVMACSLTSTAYAANGIKLGFGYDMGLGITAQLNKFNGFIGNSGIAVDYILAKENIKNVQGSVPFRWYIGAGGYAEWKESAGGRMPIGIEAGFARSLDAYVQIIPELKLVDDVRFGLGAGFGVRYQF